MKSELDCRVLKWQCSAFGSHPVLLLLLLLLLMVAELILRMCETAC